MSRLVKATAGAVFALFGLGVASPAQAVTIITFTNRALWLAALGSATVNTEDFNDSVFNDGSVATSTGTFTGTEWHDVIDTSPFKSTDWTFNSPLNAWGADFNLNHGNPVKQNQGIDLFIADGASAGVLPFPTMGNNYVGFFGFISDTPFTDVLVQAGPGSGVSEIYTMDDMSYVASVPEPSGLILLGLGFGALSMFRKGRRED